MYGTHLAFSLDQRRAIMIQERLVVMAVGVVGLTTVVGTTVATVVIKVVRIVVATMLVMVDGTVMATMMVMVVGTVVARVAVLVVGTVATTIMVVVDGAMVGTVLAMALGTAAVVAHLRIEHRGKLPGGEFALAMASNVFPAFPARPLKFSLHLLA